ncbi:hypothetical protein B0T20DRAFT_149450 [Sordaria brevicollis]|uniref:Secreted protein n=1 Tax=Sordaria brevicollis TaxID=83679 RepID=A0AAE0UDZ0_SORBR|nr:hypothetical protein B0T20DRAFT_149450 [Sordaria brevicollis]
MSTTTTSLRLFLLLLPDLLRATPLPARTNLIAAAFALFPCAGSPAPRPDTFAGALFVRCCVLADANLRMWYLHIRCLVDLTTAWLRSLPPSVRGLLCGGGVGGVLSRLRENLAGFLHRARASTYRVATKYRDVAEHIIRLYHLPLVIFRLLFSSVPSRRLQQTLFFGREFDYHTERVQGGLVHEIAMTDRRGRRWAYSYFSRDN